MSLEQTGSRAHARAHAQFHPPLVWSCLNSRGWFTSGCPQNKTLLRKHQQQQQQPQQRACWRRRRRRRTDRKSPFQQPVPHRPRGGRGQMCCSAAPVSSRCGALFFFCPRFLFFLSLVIYPPSLRCVPLFASHAWLNLKLAGPDVGYYV